MIRQIAIDDPELLSLLPSFFQAILDYQELCKAEQIEFQGLKKKMIALWENLYTLTASGERIAEIEQFFGIKSEGTLEQRKSYILALQAQTGKLNEAKIKEVANTIAGARCNVTFFDEAEALNPYPGYGTLRVQVLSPDNDKDYRYADIERTLQPLTPAHIRLMVEKYFATWQDVKATLASWETVSQMASWGAVKEYIPPQE